jgi:histidinol-phosphate aminotransferase
MSEHTGRSGGPDSWGDGANLAVLPQIRAIAPYIPGKPIEDVARELNMPLAQIVKLASNENPLGAPPSAVAAFQAAASELARYPDGNAFRLKEALARRVGVPTAWLTVGSGSNDILELAAAAMLGPGRSCVYSQYSFAVYALATQVRAARGIVVPARDLGHDLDAMAAAIAPDTRLIYLANPNNPTGTFVSGEAIAAFLQRVPPSVMVVLDEAYNEYLEPALRYDAVALVRRFPNLLVSRTFSKAYGLAALRVGYGIAQHELSDMLNRVRMPFNVSAPAQAAALAALEDSAFLQRSFEVNRAGLAQLSAGLIRLGLRVVPSHGNFVLFHIGAAAKAYAALLQQGIIVRPVANYDLPEWLRVSIGTPEENGRFLSALAVVLPGLPR